MNDLEKPAEPCFTHSFVGQNAKGIGVVISGYASEFRIGDVATLKSGGPRVTVIEVADGKARCIWHNDTGSIEEFNFPLQALKP